MRTIRAQACLLLLCILICATIVHAQVLPQPEPPFKGKIGRTVKDSTPDFPKKVEAPKGAPNILLILTDDVGFGASSTFGGPVQTPTFQHLADEGLRYNTFHTTALCSPTRAAPRRPRLSMTRPHRVEFHRPEMPTARHRRPFPPCSSVRAHD